ncbi:MAG: hypothetical protein LBR39_07560 [Coriobacteriales bacterium]|jgi:hypothetical protein|nr:hypothetical protein [Coriobacteriales bacterium]
MTLDELIELTTEEQEKWLNDELAAGKTPDDIYATLSTDKVGLGKVGIFYVPPKKSFMIKPMRGYQTTRLSGNEKADDAGIIGGVAIK